MYDQVVSEGEDVVPTNEFSIVPRQRRKWLNIVLDVNGILGQCIPKFELGRVRRVHEMRDNIFSHETPTIVGGKAVYARLNLREFLRQLSNIAVRIVVWTSMVRSNADLMASYLFTTAAMVRELAQRLSSGAAAAVCECKSHWIRATHKG